ncbi:unnamed protein product [Urochloa humidicola]
MGCWIKIRFGCMCSTSAAEPATRAKQARSGGSGKSRAVPELTLRELKDATAKFSPSRLIGRSDHAEVFLARLPGGRDAAAKRLFGSPPAYTADTNDAGTRMQKVAVASGLGHENVVPVLGYNLTSDKPVILYELAVNGTLHDALHGPRWMQDKAAGIRMPTVRELRWEERVRIALDAARGLAYLHKAGLAHENVRSTKVLLFGGLRAKISDHYGFRVVAPPVAEAQGLKVITEHQRGSQGYNTPGFGVVLLELLTGRKPLDVTLPRDQQMLSSWATPLLAEGRVQECIDPKLGDQYPPAGALKLGRIAVQCLQEKPTSRPSMDTVARLINCDVVMQNQHV